jgi:hypothetical protein
VGDEIPDAQLDGQFVESIVHEVLLPGFSVDSAGGRMQWLPVLEADDGELALRPPRMPLSSVRRRDTPAITSATVVLIVVLPSSCVHS